jgi:uncharacterized membrane protein (UPF0182 family)
MGDLFDEFKRELERRRAAAEGRPQAGDHDAGDEHDADHDTGDEDADDTDVPSAADDDEEAGDQPVPLHRRAARGGAGGAPPRRRRPAAPVGGPDDGAEPPSVRTILGRASLVIAVVVVLAIIVLAGTAIDLWTDATWYKSVGFDSVFWTRLGGQAGLFVLGFVVSLAFLLVNVWLSGRLLPPVDPERPGRFRAMTERLSQAQQQAERQSRMARPGGPGSPFGAGGPFGPAIRAGGDGAAAFTVDDIPDLSPIAGWAIAGVAVLVALGVGGALSGSWNTIALWVHRVPFSATSSVTDPIFGKDVSFFLFELPFLRLVQALVNGLLLAGLAAAGARYVLGLARGGEVFVTRVRVHLAVIGGLYLLSVALGYQLDKFELVYGQNGVATGVAYADVNARFAAYNVLTMLSGIAGALLIAGAFTRWMWPLGVVVGVWAIASLLLGTVYPQIIQRLYVDPNTYTQEEPYIANNIKMTRIAYGLDQWQTQNYQGNQPLTAADVAAEADTFTNARLWDYRPLQDTLDQLQTIKQYYNFNDVDTDRYLINGQMRQVMLSGRELAIEKNSAATGWVNQHILYTHGVGLTMVPVNEVTPEGQPQLWIRDLPPASSSGAPAVTEPRIYFGESDNHYVVVGAAQPEFDLPGGSGGAATDTTNRWTGTTGISLDSTFNRLMFALRFKDLDLLISSQITANSQLLFHRTLSDRLGLIAPFLRYDKDPYLVVDNGRLTYVQDAYTVSDRFPQATPFNPGDLGGATGLAGDPFNYIRNSVKITMDAYDGTLHLYVADPTDPIIRAWEGVFPTMFEPLSSMGASLAEHLRTPEELFNVQARVYGQYHVTNTLTFFNNTDRWTVPAAQTNQQSLPSEAYYVVMRIPGEPKAEFLLLQPMIAASRPNMIAWVAARNDVPNYGAVKVFQFPSDTTVFGPAQIEARIDQDPIISAQITLWNQSGSTVKRGNLIVVPVGNSLIYLQPVYLQSTSSAFPEFQKIVVATPTSVVWANTLEAALTQLLGGSVTPTPSPGPTASPGASATPGPSASTGPDGLPSDVAGIVAYANAHFEAAQTALHSGDFATYGAEMAKVETALKRLGELTGQPGASTAP